MARIILTALAVASLAVASGCKSDLAQTPSPAAKTKDAAAPEVPDGPSFVRFPTAAEAVQTLMRRGPRVVGFGEYHHKIGAAAVVTSLTRFRTEILPVIAGMGSDLVLETWVEAPNCGKKAAQVSRDVQQAIARPPETETELMALLRVAKERGLGRRVLTMTCEDYASFRKKDEDVDYDALLQVITRRLGDAVEKALAQSAGQPTTPTIFVYGGSMHNEVHPFAGTEAYSYVERVVKALGKDGTYLEIDLFVPELIVGSALFASQAWYPVAEREARSDSVLVFERSPTSFVVILRKGVAPAPAPAPMP